MKHLNDQYYGGNQLKEVGAPIEGTDAANKEYVDAALTNRPAAGKDIRYEPIVPFDYVQLQYLSNAASTRLDTGFALDCDNIEMEITVEAKTGSWYIFQSRENSDERTNGIAGASSGAKIQFGFSGTTIVSGISRTAGRTYTVIAKAKHGNSSIYVKEHETGEEDYKTGTYTFVPDASNLFLWGNAAGNSVASGNKILRARLWKNDVIVMDYIPAKTTVNDVEITGFYDRVSRTLKTTVVGSVTAGDVVSTTEKAISVVPNVPTKTSELVNDKGYITESDVPQADWNATSGLAQILNKPGVGKVVRVCHLQQNGRLVEDKLNPVRTDEELYLVIFDSNTIPSQWIVCDGDTAVDYTAPNVPLSTFQKDDTCLFLGKYVTFIAPFTQQEQTSLELQLLFHSRWGSMIATKQDALPSLTDNAGKVLAVNNNETGMEWVNPSDTEDVFVCTYNSTNNTMSEQPQDIVAAHNNGKVIICKFNNGIYYCNIVSDSMIVFSLLKAGIAYNGSGTEVIGITEPTAQYIVYSYTTNTWNVSTSKILQEKLIGTQTTGQNLKTINGNSLLGSGDLTVGGGDVNVQSDWNQIDNTADDYIKHKPTIPTELDDLSDVAISSPSDQQTLVYNPDTQYFENGEQRKLWNGVDVVSKLDSDYPARNGYIANATGAWSSSTSYKHWIVPVKNMKTVTVQANSSTASYYTFFSAYTPSSSSAPTTTYATGYTNTVQVEAGTSSVVNVPTDAIYMYFNTGSSSAAKPAHIYLTGIAVTPIPIIPFGTCSDSSTTTKVVTIPNVDSYYEGLLIRVTNSSTACSGTVTLNVNGLGAKPVRCNHNGLMLNVGSSWRARLTFIMSYSTANTTTGRFDVIGLDFDTKSDWNAASGSDAEILNKPTIPDPLPSMTGNSGKVLAVNSGATGVEWVTQSSGGTAPKETLRATCSTDAATQIKDVTISGYEPKDGDLISVYFSNNVGIRAQLRINSNVTCNILSLGMAIDAGIIKAGDTATFSIDRSSSPGKAYLLGIDRASVVAATMPAIPDELNDLSDVSAASPANRRVLIYDSTEQKWICEPIYYTINVFYTYNSTTDTFTVTGAYKDGGGSVTSSEIVHQLNSGRPVRCSLSTSDTGSGSRPIPIGFYLYPRDDTDNFLFTNTYYDKMILLTYYTQNDEWYLRRESIISNRVNVYSGSSAPASALGSNGDIYIQTQS